MIFAASERLVLRRARDADAETLLPSWSDRDMTRYTGVRPDVGGFLRGMIADMQAKLPGELDPGGPWYQFIVERRSDGAVVGDLGAGFGIPGERQVEIGYRILPQHHRRGYAREAVAAMINCLVKQHDIHRFAATAAAANLRSRAVLEALGFRQEGHFRQSFFCDGEWIDDVSYALLASEWGAGGAPSAP